MATPIVMPSFGMYTAEGILANWLRSDQERVEKGDPVLEIETEKAVNQVIAPASGILHHTMAMGMPVKEQGVLGFILAEGELPPSKEEALQGGQAAPRLPVGSDTSPETADSTRGAGVTSSPIARRLAREHGIDITRLKGSGPGGRVVEADVVSLTKREGRPPGAYGADLQSPVEGLGSGTRIPLSSMRRTIGERLRRGLDTAVPLTITREALVENFVLSRKEVSGRIGETVSYDALFLTALAHALRQRPTLNVVVEADAIVQQDDVNIGFAVALSDGIVAPVVRKADTLSLAEVTSIVRRLTELARGHLLRAEDVQGGTATITNLGDYDVDVFTPILNPPQSCILGIGRIAERPVLVNGRLSAAHTCWLSLTFDHRATDGVPAAQLLDGVVQLLNDVDFFLGLI